MGDGYGPMFVTLHGRGPAADATREEKKSWLRSRKIAIPGLMTSAYLSAQLYLGKDFNHTVVPFDQIFDAIRSGSVDVGLIIHEGQLTYASEGFEKVADMGEWFKAETGLPLPLGGNVIRKDFTHEQRSELNTIMKESIRYGLEHRRAAVDHSMAHARGMEVPLADEFIGMYVNDYTLDYGESGRAAIREFLGRAADQGLVPRLDKLEFVN
jgi:1,4-dihydroxy-6-naphthoate synthase